MTRSGGGSDGGAGPETGHGSGELDGAKIRALFDPILVLVAPPRTASTAVARVFWEHRSIGYYCHEPFDAVYHRRRPASAATAALVSSLGLKEEPASSGRGLVVKEMTFQVGERFPQLAGLTDRPIVFLVRDPRLAIASRMRNRAKGGQSPVFPNNESGWRALDTQVEHCRRHDIAYLLADTTEMRNHPRPLFEALFDRLGFDFSPALLTWSPAGRIDLGSLGGEQAHWYERVLGSDGLEPETAEPPPLDGFPAENGFRKHVADSLEIYRALLEDRRAIRLPPA